MKRTMSAASAALANDAPTQLQALYAEMQPRSLYPLWEVLHALVTPAPQSKAQPVRWDYPSVAAI